MIEIFGMPIQAFFGQVMLGLINGAFYATLSLGLAIIFGLLNVINFAHGVQYMMGAFAAWLLLNWLGIDYWGALILAPLIVGGIGMAIERLFISRTYKLDHLYGLLLTYGIALLIEGVFHMTFGTSGVSYEVPELLTGGRNLGFMFLPNYRLWVILVSLGVCIATWFIIERTALGVNLRAASENSTLTEAFGINVPRLITLTYGFGVALAAFAGVLATPIYSINPNMGSDLVIIAFAVVVIGGMGSILGAIVGGFGLGLIEGLTKTFYPEASAMVVFVAMAIVLLLKPARFTIATVAEGIPGDNPRIAQKVHLIMFALTVAILIVAPFLFYPVLVMKALCYALFASAFAFLLAYSGLLSFGHAAYFGIASYMTAYGAKHLGFSPELAIVAGVLVAIVLGAVLGAIAIRRQGIYFSMITLALAQMVYFICLQAEGITGGEDGIQAVPRGTLFGIFSLNDDMSLYVVVAIVFLAAMLFLYRVMNSPFGHVARAIRGNEARAISLGYKANRHKLLVFIISAGLAGLAGSMKAIVFQLASLNDVHWSMSGDAVLMTLVGGVGTLSGPVIGGIFVVWMQYFLAGIGSWLLIVKGAIFILCVLLFRSGLIGTLAKRLRLPL